MKIAVVGAGAMGSILGARFARGGHDTVLVDVVARQLGLTVQDARSRGACRHRDRGPCPQSGRCCAHPAFRVRDRFKARSSIMSS